jgi:lipase ATG15
MLSRRSRLHLASKDNPWEEDEIVGPDVESRETLLLLAKMTNNAYLEPGEAGWYDLGDGWNAVRALISTPLILLWCLS